MEMHSDLLKRKGVSNSWLILILYRGVKWCPYSYPCYISICDQRRQEVLDTVCGMIPTLIARFVGPAWGPSGADRTQMGPCWPHELCYLGNYTRGGQIASISKGLCEGIFWPFDMRKAGKIAGVSHIFACSGTSVVEVMINLFIIQFNTE